MSEPLQTVLYIAIPILVTGTFNIWLFRLQTRRDAAKESVNIIAVMEEITDGLATQLRDVRREVQDLRAGIAILLKQIIGQGEEPEWRPNGHHEE